MQDKAEQEQLKRLVLNYEQREEAEELKGETRVNWKYALSLMSDRQLSRRGVETGP